MPFSSFEPDPGRDLLSATVESLCTLGCAGRAPGTPQGQAARRLVIDGLCQAGTEPAGTDGYVQAVPGCQGANVIAQVGGHGPRSERIILVGAHYDHLGQSGGQIYWGADDNGSGVAVLLDLARRLVGRGSEVRRGVLLCAFDGEEPPFFLGPGMGSVHFVQYPTVPLERIDMMICLDIIGHALGSDETPEEIRRSILCVGAERSAGTGPLLDRVAAEARGVRVRRLDSHVVPPLSDHFAFERAGIPFLFFTCGRNEHYHMPTDIPEKLDYGKLRATSEFLADLVVVLSQRPDAPVRFLPKGREDAVTLKTLNQLIVGLPQASVRFREKSRWLQRLSREVIGGRLLSRDEQVLVGGMVLELEANLGWGFAGPDGDGR